MSEWSTTGMAEGIEMGERTREDDLPSLSRAQFVGIVDRHQRALHGFLFGLLRDREQAHDLAQDTFSAAWRAAQMGVPPFVSGGNDDERRRWLFATAYRRAISAQRRQRLLRWESFERLSAHQDPASEDDGFSFEERMAEFEVLRAALARLDPQDVACLLLRIVQGFSAAEVGQIVGATPEVVAKRLSRAKQRLRAAYEAEQG
jgi:RNA polymerase sigma factor (sigma-70 family)